MNQKAQTRTLVLALGNPIRSDDGVGIAALRRLEEDPRVPGAAELVEGGTKGLELVSYISGMSRLLVLDAVDVGAVAGRIVCIQGTELGTLPGKGNVHDLALADILNALRLLGQEPRRSSCWASSRTRRSSARHCRRVWNPLAASRRSCHRAVFHVGSLSRSLDLRRRRTCRNWSRGSRNERLARFGVAA